MERSKNGGKQFIPSCVSCVKMPKPVSGILRDGSNSPTTFSVFAVRAYKKTAVAADVHNTFGGRPGHKISLVER